MSDGFSSNPEYLIQGGGSVRRYSDDDCVAVRPVGSVGTAMERLQKSIAMLAADVDQLIERVSPVLTSAPADGAFDTGPEPAASCSVEDDLAALRRHVERTAAAVASAQARCQL